MSTVEGRRGSQWLVGLKEEEVIHVEGSEEAFGLGPEGAGRVAAVPTGWRVCRPTGAERGHHGTYREFSLLVGA